jgi:hypothetical protein
MTPFNKLKKIHHFMLNEIYEDPPHDEEHHIPEKFRPLVKEVAEWLSADMVCYINPATMEVVNIPTSLLEKMDDEELPENNSLHDYGPFRKDLNRVKTEWPNALSVGPPQAHEAYRFMEQFVHALSDVNLKQALHNALQRPKPFRHFNAIIHQSPQRESWFAFRQKCLEGYVFQEIGAGLQHYFSG